MSKYDNIVGQRFGRLVVLKMCGRDENSHRVYRCKCDCGKITDVKAFNLLYEHSPTRSCGCLGSERSREVGLVYGKKLNQLIRASNEPFGTQFQIITNKKLPKNNKSGHKGVWWDNRRNKWLAYISIQKKRIELGYFKDYEEAVKVREEAEERYFTPLIEAQKALKQTEESP